MMGIGLLVVLLAIAAAAAGGKKVVKLDPNVPDQNAEAFNRALAEERDPRELRSFASAAIASGAPNYARALIQKFLLLEGVPQPQVAAEVERFMADPTLIQRPPALRGPAPGTTQPTEGGAAPAPGATPPSPPPPQGLSSQDAQALLGAVQATLATRNPQAMRLLAQQLRQPGEQVTQSARAAAANALDQAANELERAQAAPVPDRSPGLPTAPAPGTQPPPGPAPQGGMPEALRQMFERALQSGEVQGLGTAARVLEDAGFPNEAARLRQKAAEIAAKTPPPPPEEQPSRTLDPTMPAELAADVAKQLALQGDPKILRELAARVRALGFGDTADLLDAKAAQIETLIKAGETLKDVDDLVKQGEEASKSPGQPDVHVSPQPGGGVPVAPTPKPPAQTRPAPAPAPAPQPRPLPAPKTPLQIAAENMQKHLLQLVAVHGLPGAKGKEDTFLISKFQGAAGDANPDGKYGPGTALKSAGVVSDIAPVFLWPKKSNTTTVKNYRNELLRMAREAESQGNTARAEQLERSAQRERGLGGVAGGPLAA